MARVLVTRPEPQAARTARRLAETGFEAVTLPLTEIVGLPVEAAAFSGPVDAVAVTSANALRHLLPAVVTTLTDRRCFAVGERTAKLARDLGFRDVIAGSGDAGALAAEIVRHMGAGAAVAYPCGRVRLSDFEARLAGAGFAVHPVEAYDTVAVDHSSVELAAVVGPEPIDAVLLYSANAADLFERLAWPPETRLLLARAHYFCMSPRVAAALRSVEAAQVHVAAEPTEPALLRLLAQIN